MNRPNFQELNWNGQFDYYNNFTEPYNYDPFYEQSYEQSHSENNQIEGDSSHDVIGSDIPESEVDNLNFQVDHTENNNT